MSDMHVEDSLEVFGAAVKVALTSDKYLVQMCESNTGTMQLILKVFPRYVNF